MQRNYRIFSHCAGGFLAVLMLGSIANQGDWGFFMTGTLGHMPREKAESHLLPSQESREETSEAASPSAEPVKKSGKKSELTGTVRRYRDSGRIMILGGPEAFAL